MFVTIVMADHTFWYSSLDTRIIHTLVIEFTYLTAHKKQKPNINTIKIKMYRIQKTARNQTNYYWPWNDPNDEAKPHSPKFTRRLSLTALEILNCVIITEPSPTLSLLGLRKTSITMYLFLNPTMILRAHVNWRFEFPEQWKEETETLEANVWWGNTGRVF